MDNQNQQPSVDQQSSQSVQQSAVPPSNPHKSKIPLFILAIFIFLILISGIGYFLNISKLKTSSLVKTSADKQNLTPTQTAKISPTQTFDETANWKTYSNTKYGFSFQYPERYDKYIDEFPFGIKVGCACENFDWFDIEVLSTNLSPKLWWQQNGKQVFNGKVGLNNKYHEEMGKIISQTSKVTKSMSYEEIQAWSTIPPTPKPGEKILPIGRGAAIPFNIYLFQTQQGLVMITQYITNDYQSQEFDQILSTFKFTP